MKLYISDGSVHECELEAEEIYPLIQAAARGLAVCGVMVKGSSVPISVLRIDKHRTFREMVLTDSFTRRDTDPVPTPRNDK